MLGTWLPLVAISTLTTTTGTSGGDETPSAGFDLSGEAVLGWRFVSVDGNREQYDEDLNLDSGPVLRDFYLDGKRKAGSSGIRSFLLDAHGIGDPWTSGRAEVVGSALKAVARYDRSVFDGRGSDDFHPFDFKREFRSLRFESVSGGVESLHAGLELTDSRRDGLSVGTRSVGFGYLGGGSVHQEGESRGAHGNLGFGVAGWNVTLEGEVEDLSQDDHREFAGPSPADPTVTHTERFRSNLDSTEIGGGARARRSFEDGKIAADFGFRFTEMHGSGHMHSHETGVFLPGDPFERTTDADPDLVDRFLQMDAGLRRQVSPDFAWRARVEHVRQSEGGDLVTHTLLEEPPGSPPSELIQNQSLHFESDLDLLELGVESTLSPYAELDLSIEGGLDHEVVQDVADGVTRHAFDDTLDQFGGRVTLSVETSREVTVSVEGGYELAPTHDADSQAFLSLEDERGVFAGARVRWKPRTGVCLGAGVMHRQRDIHAFGSHYESDVFTLSGSYSASLRWTADAAYSLRLYDLVADTVIVILDGTPQQVPAQVFFRGVQNVLSGSVSFEVAPSFRPRLGASAAVVNGDADLRYATLLLDLPWKGASNLTLGAEIDVHRYDSAGSEFDGDYNSAALTVYIRTGF